MHGLIRSCECLNDKELRDRRRYHNCGLCKSIGADYGQFMRLFLNRDVVFLTELISSLLGADIKWPDAVRSFNCFRIPSYNELSPLFSYCSAICVYAAELQLDDNIRDEYSQIWHLARHFLRRRFKCARKNLQKLGFPLDLVTIFANQQALIENNLPQSGSSFTRLDIYAEPTSKIFGEVFRFAATLQGTNASLDSITTIGSEIGRLLYIIDAAEDVKADRIKRRFNAVRAAFDIPQHILELPADIKIAVSDKVRTHVDKIKRNIDELQIRKDIRDHFLRSIETSTELRLNAAWTSDNLSERIKIAYHATKSQMQNCGNTNQSMLSLSYLFKTSVAAIMVVPFFAENVFAGHPKNQSIPLFSIDALILCAQGICGCCIMCMGLSCCFNCVNSCCFDGDCDGKAPNKNRKEIIVIHKKAGPCD